MTISLRLVDPISKISRDINEAIAKEMNKRIKRNLKRVSRNIIQSAKTWIIAQPEMRSIEAEGVAFSLNAQFGLYPSWGMVAVDAIATAVASSLDVKVTPFNRDLKGRVEIGIQPTTFQNLVGLPYTTVLTDNGALLPWLDWLLFEGDRVIIIGYNYSPDSRGRSGGGVMELGAGWRIDPSFSGTADDNFVTRALTGKQKEMTTLVQQLFS